VFKWLFRFGEGSERRRFERLTKKVNRREQWASELTDTQLQQMTRTFRDKLDAGVKLDDLLPDAFAVVREASSRILGKRHFDVQVVGACALHSGCIAEMRTGEGKTLVALMTAYLQALPGQGVHVVTVNDYLAARDAEQTGRVQRFLGLTTGVLYPDMPPEERRLAYQADITYGTISEFGFDYLRDNMAMSPHEQMQRPLNFVLLDEVDSILIDEARTPLVINGSVSIGGEGYEPYATLVKHLTRETDYTVDEKKRRVGLLEPGIAAVEKSLNLDNLYGTHNARHVGAVTNALLAKELYLRDRDYVVAGGEIVIVDMNTGRQLAGRQFSEGLHQAIGAKEGVDVDPEFTVYATITIQNYVRLYPVMCGMTGTAMSAAGELHRTFHIDVVEIPTNKPIVRTDHNDVVFANADAKWAAVVEKVASIHATGQPVLLGVTSVQHSEQVSKLLKQRGIPHNVLNAKNHAQEAPIIADAGALDAVTVATNMAGRGTDIILGGNPETRATQRLTNTFPDLTPQTSNYQAQWAKAVQEEQETTDIARQRVCELGGLFVLGTERHDSRRIDDQLRGRSGRQGDPGESQFYIALDDEVLRLNHGERIDAIRKRLKVEETEPLSSRGITRAIRTAQRKVQERNEHQRADLLKYDNVTASQRKAIYQERQWVLNGGDITPQVHSFALEVIDTLITTTRPTADLSLWNVDNFLADLAYIYPHEWTPQRIKGYITDGHLSDEEVQSVLKAEIVADMYSLYDKRISEYGEDTMNRLHRSVAIASIDRLWHQHLIDLELLRDAVGLRSMANKDPFVEYQRDAFRLYQVMQTNLKTETVRGVWYSTPTTWQQTPLVIPIVLTGPGESGDGDDVRLRQTQAPSSDFGAGSPVL